MQNAVEALDDVEHALDGIQRLVEDVLGEHLATPTARKLTSVCALLSIVRQRVSAERSNVSIANDDAI